MPWYQKETQKYFVNVYMQRFPQLTQQSAFMLSSDGSSDKTVSKVLTECCLTPQKTD